MGDSLIRAEEDALLTNNFLRISDELVRQVDRANKYVLIMIIVVIVAFPTPWYILAHIVQTPYADNIGGYITLVIDVPVIAFGVKQWMILRKWTARYKEYQERQKVIDAKLDFEGAGEAKAEKQ